MFGSQKAVQHFMEWEYCKLVLHMPWHLVIGTSLTSIQQANNMQMYFLCDLLIQYDQMLDKMCVQ